MASSGSDEASTPGEGQPPADAGDAAAEAKAAEGDSDSPASDDDGELAVEVEVEAPEDDPAALLEQARAKEKDAHERMLRAMADLENYRRRSRKEIEDGKVEAQSRVLREMLPVVDNLERALEAAPEGDGGMVEGVQLVLRQFAQALERCGVKPVDASGKAFDPNLHEAVSQIESDQPPGTVVEVLQRGYLIGERLLRPAMVVVARAPAAKQPEGGGEAED